MTQDDGGYDLKHTPPEPPAPPATPPTPPGDAPPQSTNPSEPGWVPPVPVVEKEFVPTDLTKSEAVEYESGQVDDPVDVNKHKGMAALGYVFFLIPLVAAPNSKFARYHANQSLLLFLLMIAVVVTVIVLQVGEFLNNRFIDPRIAILGWFFACGLVLLQIAMLVGWCIMWIIGIIHAANGERKPLPVVGHWTLIK